MAQEISAEQMPLGFRGRVVRAFDADRLIDDARRRETEHPGAFAISRLRFPSLDGDIDAL